VQRLAGPDLTGRFLHSVDDLSLAEVEAVLLRARELEAGAAPRANLTGGCLGLLFLSPSLRTRVGFAVAAGRLGGAYVDVLEVRQRASMSQPENFSDILRVASGMVDVVVVRTPFHLDRTVVEASLASPCINGGDGDGEHPTQALIDLYAIERARGSLAELSVCICGDLTTRVTRSLLRLLGRALPRELVLVAPAGRDDPKLALPESLVSRTRRGTLAESAEADVLYMAGLPEGDGEHRLSAAARLEFTLTADRLRDLRPDALVLSPMPVIDEITPAARSDPRVGVFTQCDRGIDVRVALLERMLSQS